MKKLRRRKIFRGDRDKELPPKALLKLVTPVDLDKNFEILTKYFKALLVGILVFGFAVKLIRLSYPPKYYFDEVYHAFTAVRYLQSDKQTYDPWAKPPKDVAFEWSHPPTAKLIMAGVMKVFGESSFGWRMGSVIFGTAAIGVSALFAFELFGSVLVSLLVAFLLTFEGLIFAQSRIAMNDAYFICFAICSLLSYAVWRRKLAAKYFILSGVFLGLAASTKWTAFYLFGIYFIDSCRSLFWASPIEKRNRPFPWKLAIFSWVVLPVLIYMISYIHYFSFGYTWAQFKELQRQMWAYHNNLKAQHSYQSKPWQWIFNLRPVWLHVEYDKSERIGNIYNLGNSVILLMGLVAVYWSIFQKRIHSWAEWIITLCYFMLWLPWIFSPRIMLFYHYAPAVPFLCIHLARYLGYKLQSEHSGERRFVFFVLIASVVWFVFFYPNLTGILLPRKFCDVAYLSFPGWK